MRVDLLLSKLELVRQIGVDRWMARCPAHEDRSPSLSVREKDDGTVLVHCFAGCGAHEVLAAVGLEVDVLFPPRNSDYVKGERRPVAASDALRCLQSEVVIVMAVGRALLQGTHTEDDHERLLIALDRIATAMTATGIWGRQS